jgi:hypothetical protein
VLFLSGYCRKRLGELFVHRMNLNDKETEVMPTSFTREEVKYLLKYALDGTDEVPFNSPKAFQPMTKDRGDQVVFEKFTLRLTLPNNVCQLKDGRYLVCRRFFTLNETICIEGSVAYFVQPMYDVDELDSREVGLVSCFGFAEDTITVEADEVKAKVVPFPVVDRDVKVQDLLSKAFGGFTFETHSRWYLVNFVA